MSLESLLPELIYEIASRLHKKDIERFFLFTWNLQIYAVCRDLLKPIAAAKRFEKRMRERFKKSASGEVNAYSWPIIREQGSSSLDGLKTFGPYRANLKANADFLGPFTGKLEWLRPYGGELTLDDPDWDAYIYEGTVEFIEYLEKEATSVGVTIPQAFLTLMRNKSLQKRIDLVGNGNFLEVGELRKCVPSMCDGGNGYLLRFQHDAREPWDMMALYLDAGLDQRHCVLGGPVTPDNDTADSHIGDRVAEPNDGLVDYYGIDMAKEMKAILEADEDLAWTAEKDWLFQSSDFEEWLLKRYLTGALSYASAHGEASS